jgi:hypothetical protein
MAKLKMPQEERVKLRKRLRREFGPADIAKQIEGLADAARRVAQEEAAMAKPLTTDKIN